ncbi:hypothetical protein IPZ58_21400 [Streptomyces roseoverticillatus]|uniref:hypothetical protein n=1 Tax=Streptomyces roseoverticillatus TaxID=66429 RepID=UPI001F352484|nr:hypothetical protein [Streptomyces roseoverticillatus]MCF3104125.1 hypothetical protein [Streptomyces roseoverticillatus]
MRTVTYKWTAELYVHGTAVPAHGTVSGPRGYSVDDAYRDFCAAMAQRGVQHVVSSFRVRRAQG